MRELGCLEWGKDWHDEDGENVGQGTRMDGNGRCSGWEGLYLSICLVISNSMVKSGPFPTNTPALHCSKVLIVAKHRAPRISTYPFENLDPMLLGLIRDECIVADVLA